MRFNEVLLRIKKVFFILIGSFLFTANVFAVKVGEEAPSFTLKNQDGINVSLTKNKNDKWLVLYFYPKAGTPGCTKQACAFRDAIKNIENEGAVVYGISMDSVESLKKFKEEHKLNFTLLSDEKGTISEAYDTKIPLLNISKRITFIIDPKFIIRSIDKDVDPALDAIKVSKKIQEFKL